MHLQLQFNHSTRAVHGRTFDDDSYFQLGFWRPKESVLVERRLSLHYLYDLRTERNVTQSRLKQLTAALWFYFQLCLASAVSMQWLLSCSFGCHDVCFTLVQYAWV